LAIRDTETSCHARNFFPIGHSALENSALENSALENSALENSALENRIP
jgi:hypothetical protein